MLACPWDFLPPSELQFCEHAVCGWIVEPANTVSNLGFVLVGTWILKRAVRLRVLGVISILTGVGSAFYHGTHSLPGEIADFSAMDLEGAFLLTANWARWRRVPFARLQGWFWRIVALCIAILWLRRNVGIPLFIAQIALFLALEARLYYRDRGAVDYRFLGALFGVFGVSYALWWLDYLRIVCAPNQHWISGHAIWHLLGALSYYLLYRYYVQFPVFRDRVVL